MKSHFLMKFPLYIGKLMPVSLKESLMCVACMITKNSTEALKFNWPDNALIASLLSTRRRNGRVD